MRRQKRYGFFAVFSAVISVLLIFCVCIVLLVFLVKPYKVRKITYECNDSNFEQAAAAYANEYMGKNTIGEMKDKRLPELESILLHCLPDYKNIKCEIKFGGNVKISAETRSNLVVFSEGDTVIVTDRDGYVVLISDITNYKNEIEGLQSFDGDEIDILVKGFGLSQCTLGEKIISGENISWKSIAEVYFSVLANEPLEKRIKTIFFMPGENLYFNCENELYVNMGSLSDSDKLFERMARLSEIFNMENFDFSDGTIFMGEKGFDTFRPNKNSEEVIITEEEH